MSQLFSDPSNDTVVECPGECASWACIIGKVGYHGKGCDTENPCKDVSGAKTSTCGTIPLAGSQCNDLQYKIVRSFAYSLYIYVYLSLLERSRLRY